MTSVQVRVEFVNPHDAQEDEREWTRREVESRLKYEREEEPRGTK